MLAVALLAVAAPAAHGFTIDTTATLVPGIDPHLDEGGRHELVTADAIRAAMRNPSPNMILNVNRGVENTDIVHQWDEESHFDNFNQRTVEGRRAMDRGLGTVRSRLLQAQSLAKDNPQFLSPSFTTFRAIAADVRNTIAKLAVDRTCVTSVRCPKATFVARAAALTVNNAPLLLVQSPDPHQPTNPDSPFFCCGVSGFKRILGQPPRFFRERMNFVSAQIAFALGSHRGRTLAQILGASHPLVRTLQRDRDAIDAYLAAQLMGHAMHATEDFFAHSNYVELTAGVPVGTPIPASIDPRGGIPIPPGFPAFTRTGLQTALGPARFAELESGAVKTIWLGEGDFCRGDGPVFSVFNPKAGFSIGPRDFGPVKVPKIDVNVVGSNPGPPPGHRFCHYTTSTTMGLNKDKPGAEEPSFQNFPWAAGTATREAAYLWKAFLDVVAPDRIIPPQTDISVGPAKVVPDTTARFEFGSNAQDARFTCSLDGARFRPCTSPKVVPGLKPGRHVFLARAVDSVGTTDRSPDAWRWTVDPNAPAAGS